MRAACLLTILLVILGTAPATAQVIDNIRENKSVTVAFREDAPPYSYLDAAGKPVGYTIELCRAALNLLGADLGLGEIAIEYLPVGAEDRFSVLASRDADLLCGATTVTLSRRELVDFTIATFVDGASVIFRASGPKSLEDLEDRKIGVRAGTTTEASLTQTLSARNIASEILHVANHKDGMARLEKGEIEAYFADRAILGFLLRASQASEGLRLAENYFTYEPYALALPKGDSAFRLALDRSISRLYRSGAIEAIFHKTFGADAQPSEALRALYLISALPE